LEFPTSFPTQKGTELKIEIKSKHIPMILSLDKGIVPSGVTIEKLPVVMDRGLSEPWAIAIVSIATTVSIPIFVKWLNKKITDKKSTKITINRKEIHYDEGKITRLIEETRDIEQNR
jgi:hypothetical protein